MADCSLCHVPIATGDCPHIEATDDQVTMSRRRWKRLVEELDRARAHVAAPEDQGDLDHDGPPARIEKQWILWLGFIGLGFRWITGVRPQR